MAEPSETWDQAHIERLISDGVEENLNLDYKAAGLLVDPDKNKVKSGISKHISAMANSAGGVIIFGIAEFRDDARKHLPEKIDPIERYQISREQFEQLIHSNIQPKIDGIVIHPVPIDSSPNHVVYVVEIPQSRVAHQANDFRYYKRYNFASVPMEDYERRDVDGRQQFPRIVIEFDIEIVHEEVRDSGELSHLWGGQSSKPPQIVNRVELIISACNEGKIFAQYVNAFIEIPDILLPPLPDDEFAMEERETFPKDGILYYRHFEDNTQRDIVDIEVNMFGGIPKYGPSRYDPILPSRYHIWDAVRLRNDFEGTSLDGLFIEWEVSADNAPPLTGKIAVKDIKVTDKRSKAD